MPLRLSAPVKALVAAVLAALALAATAPAAGASFKPDRSFGKNGVVTTTTKGLALTAYDAVAVGGGKTVVAGQSNTSKGVTQVIVARYLKNGRLDSSFARKGIFKSSFPSAQGPFVARAVGVQPRTGKLVIAGGYGQGSVLLMRLTAKGALDRTFGPKRSGIATLATGDVAGSLAFNLTGGIVVGSSNQNANGRPYVVAAFTPSGRLDTTFGSGGQVQLIFWDPNQASSAGLANLAIDSSGQITGSSSLDYIGGSGHGSAGVFKLTATGQPVTSFGDGGHVELAKPRANGVLPFWLPASMVVDRAGRITVTGEGTGLAPTSKGSVTTARIDQDGRPDITFGPDGDGWAITDGVSDGTNPLGGAALISAGGLAIGTENWLVGLTAAGAANPLFGSSGLFRISKPKGVATYAVLTSGGGSKLTLAGSAGNALYLSRWSR